MKKSQGLCRIANYRAFGSRGGVFIADAAKIDPKINQCVTILASVLGVPGDIIEECMKNKRHLAGILIFPGPFRNSKHSENLDKSWSKYIFWRYWMRHLRTTKNPHQEKQQSIV